MNKQGGRVGQKQFAFDITERRRAERTLLESEKKYRMLFETMAQGIVFQNAEGHIVSANPAAERILGLTLAQMQGRTSLDPRWKAIHEDGSDFPGDTHPAMVALRTGNDVRNVIMGVFHPGDNEYVWININAMPQIKPGRTKPYRVYTTFEDITERRKAEEALKESEAKYRNLIDQAWDAIFVADQGGKILLVNEQACLMLGYTQAELVQLNVKDTYFAEERAAVAERIAKVQRGEHLRYERSMVRKDGTTLPVEVAIGMFPNGLIQGIVRNITERRKVEEALRESEETMRYMVKYDPNAIAIYDLNLRYIAVSDRYLQDYEVKEENVIGKHHYEVFPEMPQRWKDVHQRCLSGAIERNDDDYFERPDGSRTYNRWECRPWHRGDGTIGGIITYTEVTTERKKAEIALRESEERHRTILRTAMDGFWRVDLQGRLLEVNEAYCRMSGYSEQELLSMSIPDLEDVEIPAETAAHLQRIAAQGEDRFESRHRRKDGSCFTVEISVQYKPAAGGPLVAFLRDITERKRAEEEIQSLARFPSENPSPVLRIARDGTLLYVNQAGLRLLPDENLQVGRPSPAFLSEVVLQSINDGTLKMLDLEHGGQIYSYFIAPIVAAGYANLYGRNVTDRRKAEHELRQSHEQLRALAAYLESARENERTRIARELHDELGQTLTALKIDLDWIIRRMQKEDIAGRAKINVMRGLIDDTIDTVRRISIQLRPGLLDDMGLAAAMEWQTRDVAGRAGLEYDLALGEEDIVLDKELATALFRIFQETLTNVVRHAGATRIRVSLDVGPDELAMRIRDDGKGITDGQAADSKSLGLLGMRERIRPWGGIVMFQGAAGQGTTVTVRVPHRKSPSGGAP
jgi:PAS domain S-box-containing protein